MREDNFRAQAKEQITEVTICMLLFSLEYCVGIGS